MSFQVAKVFGYPFNIVWIAEKRKGADICYFCSEKRTGVENSYHCMSVPRTFGRHCLIFKLKVGRQSCGNC